MGGDVGGWGEREFHFQGGDVLRSMSNTLPSWASYNIMGPPSDLGNMVTEPSQVFKVTGWIGGGRRCQWIRSFEITWSKWFWQHWWNTWYNPP